MNNTRFISVIDALILLSSKNTSCSRIDSSCIQVELFNRLLECGYIELQNGNSGLRITKKGNNIIAFSTKNMYHVQEAVIETSD